MFRILIENMFLDRFLEFFNNNKKQLVGKFTQFYQNINISMSICINLNLPEVLKMLVLQINVFVCSLKTEIVSVVLLLQLSVKT
mgnify:CR=1 FL=1